MVSQLAGQGAAFGPTGAEGSGSPRIRLWLVA